MFNTTIEENLKLAKPDATEDEMIEALIAANAWKFIKTKLSKTGLKTQVGSSGGQLSGGQKQRIAIARAFLKNPRIILLDEATSALDKTNERMVQEAIDRYRENNGNISTITIAHRLSTIRYADKIVALVNGVLTESGNHDELMKNFPDGVYAGFYNMQNAAEAAADEDQADNSDEEAAIVAELKKGSAATKLGVSNVKV